MITKEYAEAYAEIDEIIGYLPEEYTNKIPLKLREFFKKAKENDYVSKIDPYKELDNQDIKPKTKTLLTIIYREYWCNEEEKAELDKILIENDMKHEAEIREKYNPDNIFKKREKNEEIEKVEETALINYDDKSWYQKAFDYIRNIFKNVFKK